MGAKHPLLCRQRQSTALATRWCHPSSSANPHPPPHPRCSCPQHRRSFIPRRPPAQVLSSGHPQLGLCPLQPLSSCHRAASPHSNHPSLPAPLQGTLPPQEGSHSLPSFTPWWSYRAREALPSEDSHFLAQIPRYRALGYHLRGQQLKLSVLLGTTVEKCWPHSEFLSEKGVIVSQTALTPKILAVAQQLFRV